MTLTASEVASLSSSLSHWEYAEYFFAGLVTLGCAGEYVANFTDWFTCGIDEKKKRLEKRSTLLLVAALVFELICLAKTNQISGRIIGSLGEKAEQASNETERAITNADSAISKAQSADDKSQQADLQADKATEQVKVVEKRAQRLAKQERAIEQAENKLAEAQHGLDRRVNPRWRNLIIDGKKIGDFLKGNSTSGFEILYAPGESEAYTTALVLSGLLSSAGWKQTELRPIEDHDAVPGISNPNMPSEMNAGASFNVGWGMSINVRSCPYPPFGHEKDCAACALWMALGGGVITIDPRLPPDLVRIVIAKKP